MATFEDMWGRIRSHQGDPFRQVRGGEFTYRVEGSSVWPDRTNRRLSRSQFRKTFERVPLSGPGEIQDLQGPSYLFAVLMDPRIRRNDY